MFHENLVESSPEKHKRSRWPMAAAFATQIVVAGALLILPLFSIGVIPLVQRIPLFTQLTAPPETEASPRAPGGGGGGTPDSHEVIILNTAGRSSFPCLCPSREKTDSGTPPEIPFGNGKPGWPFGAGDGPRDGSNVRLEEPQKRPRFSHLDEGMLVQKVLPIYPHMAIVTGVQGDVRLYAIIARDGSIVSLRFISGPPLLMAAAMDAVRQWKYRPYILNGEPVEVETYITVTFKRGN